MIIFIYNGVLLLTMSGGPTSVSQCLVIYPSYQYKWSLSTGRLPKIVLDYMHIALYITQMFVSFFGYINIC